MSEKKKNGSIVTIIQTTTVVDGEREELSRTIIEDGEDGDSADTEK